MQPTAALPVIIPVCNSDVQSNFEGHVQLVQFYNYTSQYSNINIQLSFKKANWFDANMVSFFSSLLYRLNRENNLTFSTSYEEIYPKFEVLFRNGFLQVNGTPNQVNDDRLTTLPFKIFDKNDKNEFIDYVDYNLLKHRGMEPVQMALKEQIKDDLIELMTNVNYHSNTSDPFFVCGQFYPRMSCIKLTITDLGLGFLPKINEITEGVISTDIEAITWALSGKTTKPLEGNVPGGLGIKGIYKYCTENNGTFSIATGKAFWSTELSKSIIGPFRLLPHPIIGSTINLHFYTK